MQLGQRKMSGSKIVHLIVTLRFAVNVRSEDPVSFSFVLLANKKHIAIASPCSADHSISRSANYDEKGDRRH